MLQTPLAIARYTWPRRFNGWCCNHKPQKISCDSTGTVIARRSQRHDRRFNGCCNHKPQKISCDSTGTVIAQRSQRHDRRFNGCCNHKPQKRGKAFYPVTRSTVGLAIALPLQPRPDTTPTLAFAASGVPRSFFYLQL